MNTCRGRILVVVLALVTQLALCFRLSSQEYFAGRTEVDPETQSTTCGDLCGELVSNPIEPEDSAGPENRDVVNGKLAREKQAALRKRVASAYKPVFFDNDFSYLCEESYCDFYLGDRLKQRCLPWGGTCDVGGQYRWRYQVEQNIRGFGLTGLDDQFLLQRTRLFGNFRLGPNFRFYAEMLDAASNNEQYSPRLIEENRLEIQNLFLDARIGTVASGTLTARVGRQELLNGLQRTVSPLDWANTRRTFQGAKLMWQKNDLAVDAFWANPLNNLSQNIDSPDRDQEFMGMYSTYTGRENQTSNLYFLRLLNRRGTNNFKFNTIGLQWHGSHQSFLWDFESACQFGRNTDGSDHAAGMVTLGLGHEFQNHCWKPKLLAYYDWASGDDATGQGNGFHHQFPLAHKFLGFMDLYGRRNIEDANLQLTLQPLERLQVLAWYHYMCLETPSDTPYSVAMTAFNPNNAPGSTELGHEIDLLATWNLTLRQQLVLGYSHFISGDYYRTTAGVPYDGNADFFYTEWAINF